MWNTSRFPAASRHTPVMRWWVRPDNRRKVAFAAWSSAGLPKIRPSMLTTESAAIMGISGRRASTASPFRWASVSTVWAGVNSGGTVSSTPETTTSKSTPACSKSIFRLG